MLMVHIEEATRIATCPKGSSRILTCGVPSSLAADLGRPRKEWPEGTIRDALGTTEAYIVTQVASFEQAVVCPQIGYTRPLLQAVDALHHRVLKQWSSRLGYRCVRSDQRQQLFPLHPASISSSSSCLRMREVLRLRTIVFYFMPRMYSIYVISQTGLGRLKTTLR